MLRCRTVSTCCLLPGKERPTSSGLVTAVWPRSQRDDRLDQCVRYSQSQSSTRVSSCGCRVQCTVLQQAPPLPALTLTIPSMHAEHRLLAVVRAEAGDGAQKQFLQFAPAAPRHHDGNCPQLISGAAEDTADGVRAGLRLHVGNDLKSGAAPDTSQLLDDGHGQHDNACCRKHASHAHCRMARSYRDEVHDRRRLQRLHLGAEPRLQELLGGLHHLLVGRRGWLRQVVHRRGAVMLHWWRWSLNDMHDVQLIAPADEAKRGLVHSFEVPVCLYMYAFILLIHALCADA